jgi:hypothetical protein
MLESVYMSSKLAYECAEQASVKAYHKARMEQYLHAIRQMEKDEHMSEIRKAAEEYDV